MLQSTGSQRVGCNLVTEHQHIKSLVLLFLLFGLISCLLAHMGPLTLSGKGLSSHHHGRHQPWLFCRILGLWDARTLVSFSAQH